MTDTACCRSRFGASGLLLAAALGLACGEPAAEWRAPNIVLISIDTLRADRLARIGPAGSTTPRIDQLASQSVVFERAYTQAPHTLAAHTSLLTGLYPGRHGVLFRGDSLATQERTLAELLTAHGYRSIAVVNALYLSPEFRIDRGFEVYDYANDLLEGRNAEQSNRRILRELQQDSDRPFFLFAHYFDAHSDTRSPYEAPQEFVDRHAGPPPSDYRLERGRPFGSRQMLALNQRGGQLSASERQYLMKLYDAGVAYTDHQIGELLDALDTNALLEHSIVILTSDHGEEFQEHGELLHAQIFEEGVRIPLLVSLPEMRGSTIASCQRGADAPAPAAGRVEGLAQLVDVFATLVECLGIEAPERLQGQSFLDMLSGGTGAREWAYFESSRARQRGILREGWKLVEFHDRPARLFDLSADPDERSDVAGQHPDIVDRLGTELARYADENDRTRSQGEGFTVPLEVERALEALGYSEGRNEVRER